MRQIQLRYPISHSTIGRSATAETLSGEDFAPTDDQWCACGQVWGGSILIGKGQSERIKEEKGNEKGTKRVNRHEKRGPSGRDCWGFNMINIGGSGTRGKRRSRDEKAVFRDFWTKNGMFLKKRRHGEQGAPQGHAIELERRAKEGWWRRYSRAKVQKCG